METEKKTQHQIVETYAQDMAEAISSDKTGGLVKKIIHGEEENEALKRSLSPESKKNKFFMIISFVFILVALVLILFFSFTKTSNTVPVEKQFTPLIFNDKNSFIEIGSFDTDEITKTLVNRIKTTTVKPNGIEGIHLTFNKNIVGLREFIKLIKGNFVPGDMNFVSDNFLIGVVNSVEKDFFVIIKVRSVADIFNSLRSWENKMFSDLHYFFGVGISFETKYLLTKNFDDGIIENKNARILYDNNDQIVLAYIFANDNTVVIAKTENAIHEVMLRLTSSQIKK